MERGLVTAYLLEPDISVVGPIPLGTLESRTMVAVGEFGAHKGASATSKGHFHLGSFYAPIGRARYLYGFPDGDILPRKSLGCTASAHRAKIGKK